MAIDIIKVKIDSSEVIEAIDEIEAKISNLKALLSELSESISVEFDKVPEKSK